MAPSLPHQNRRLTWRAAGAALAATTALAWLGSCGEEQPDSRPAAAAEPTRRPSPQPESATTQSPREVIDALLDRHHGPLKGTLDRAVLELRTAPKAPPMQVLVALPDNVRLDHADGPIDVLIEGAGWRCVGREPARKLEGQTLSELKQMRYNVSAVLLDPLYRAKTVKRAGPGVFSLILPAGQTWRLEIVESTLQLVELRGPGGPVRFVEFLETGVTVLPKKVELPEFGVRWVEFLANDLVVLNPTLFMDPTLTLANATGAVRTRQTKTLANPTEKPEKPIVQDIESRMFLVNADPGTWEGRRDLLMREGEKLFQKGQAPNGLQTYRETETGMQLLIPFRPDPSRDHQPYVRGPDDEVWHMPRHQAVVVAPTGPWDDCVARGRSMIAAYLEANDLEAEGEMLVIPFLHAGSIPTEADLEKLEIRIEQRVRARD